MCVREYWFEKSRRANTIHGNQLHSHLKCLAWPRWKKIPQQKHARFNKRQNCYWHHVTVACTSTACRWRCILWENRWTQILHLISHSAEICRRCFCLICLVTSPGLENLYVCFSISKSGWPRQMKQNKGLSTFFLDPLSSRMELLSLIMDRIAACSGSSARELVSVILPSCTLLS